MKYSRIGIILVIAGVIVFLLYRQWHKTDKSNKEAAPAQEQTSAPDKSKQLGRGKAFQDAEKMTTPQLVWKKLEDTQDIDHFKPNVPHVAAISLTEQQEFIHPEVGEQFILPLPNYGDLAVTVDDVYSSSETVQHWTGKLNSSHSSISSVVVTIGPESSLGTIYTEKGQYSLHLVNDKGWVYQPVLHQPTKSDVIPDDD